MTPAMHYTLVRGLPSSNQIWWPWGIPKQFYFWLTPGDPCMTLDTISALCSGQGLFWPNLVPRGHLKGNLWMTFDLWWCCFKNMLSNHGSLPPTAMSCFSSVLQSMTKRIARHSSTQTLILVVREHLYLHYALRGHWPHLVAVGIS